MSEEEEAVVLNEVDVDVAGGDFVFEPRIPPRIAPSVGDIRMRPVMMIFFRRGRFGVLMPVVGGVSSECGEAAWVTLCSVM